LAAIDFAHHEGFNRSEQDVTLQRVVTALSGPVKKAFSDFSSSPFVARSLFAEVGATPDQDSYAVLDYDGDYNTRRGFAYVAGSSEVGDAIEARLAELLRDGLTQKKAEKALRDIWSATREQEAAKADDLLPEIVLLDRSELRENRFRVLDGEKD